MNEKLSETLQYLLQDSSSLGDSEFCFYVDCKSRFLFGKLISTGTFSILLDISKV